jgi:hypothetical protein
VCAIAHRHTHLVLIVDKLDVAVRIHEDVATVAVTLAREEVHKGTRNDLRGYVSSFESTWYV